MSQQLERTELVHEFAMACVRTLYLCAESDQQKAMVDKLSTGLKAKKRRQYEAEPLACLSNLALVKDMKLAKDFREFAMYLPWKPTPRTVDNGHTAGIMNFNDLFDLPDVVAGLMYVDVEQNYPEHNHAAAELYFLISGTAHWRYGGNHDYQKITAGNVLFNHAYNWHGVKAGPTPVLAMFLQCR